MRLDRFTVKLQEALQVAIDSFGGAATPALEYHPTADPGLQAG